MHHTIFDTPVVNTLLRAVSRATLHLTGWKIEGSLPAHAAKSVLIAAPHTSNWDLPYTLMLAFSLRLRVYWMGKQSLFRAPFGGVMRWLGGIPVNRGRKSSLVDQMTEKFANSKHFHLAITPEGTRKANPNWKKGFYYIALKAQVPIMLIGIDYPSKTISSTKAVMPTGDIEKDMREIKLYFKNFKGKNPENFDLGNI